MYKVALNSSKDLSAFKSEFKNDNYRKNSVVNDEIKERHLKHKNKKKSPKNSL